MSVDRPSQVCLTFDFDGFSLWMSRGLTSRGPLSRGEFGAAAVPRILRLLAERGIPSTWFVPAHTASTYPSLVRQIVDEGHEVALHGWNHEAVRGLGRDKERDVLHRAFETVVAVSGTTPSGNRAIPWEHSDHTVELLTDLGLLYDSSLMATDYAPYFTRRPESCTPDAAHAFREETRLVQLPVSWSLDDYPLFEYFEASEYVMPGLRAPEEVFENFYDDVRYMARDGGGGVCVIAFHPQVIGRGHRMLGLEAFLDRLTDLPVSFDRCDAVAQRYLSLHATRAGDGWVN